MAGCNEAGLFAKKEAGWLAKEGAGWFAKEGGGTNIASYVTYCTVILTKKSNYWRHVCLFTTGHAVQTGKEAGDTWVCGSRTRHTHTHTHTHKPTPKVDSRREYD